VTLLEVVFALLMFATSGAASMFAISTMTMELDILGNIHAIHDAADEICALWFAGASVPSEITVDGRVCRVHFEVPESEGAVHLEIQSGKDSESIWLDSVS
jgi:hypothetical protein